MSETTVLVQVAPSMVAGREIRWGAAANLTEQLDARVDDVRRAVVSGAAAVAGSLPALPHAAGWDLDELSATFGITLTAEAGALVTKASAAATFEVTVTFKRHEQPDAVAGQPDPR